MPTVSSTDCSPNVAAFTRLALVDILDPEQPESVPPLSDRRRRDRYFASCLADVRRQPIGRGSPGASQDSSRPSQNSRRAARRANDRGPGRRITESFAKAVEQLGNDKQLATRLGGIYTLERIAQESEREYWPIMETLTAYVRENAPWPPRRAVANPFVELQGRRVGEAAGESTRAAESEDEEASVRPP